MCVIIVTLLAVISRGVAIHWNWTGMYYYYCLYNRLPKSAENLPLYSASYVNGLMLTAYCVILFRNYANLRHPRTSRAYASSFYHMMDRIMRCIQLIALLFTYFNDRASATSTFRLPQPSVCVTSAGACASFSDKSPTSELSVQQIRNMTSQQKKSRGQRTNSEDSRFAFVIIILSYQTLHLPLHCTLPLHYPTLPHPP